MSSIKVVIYNQVNFQDLAATIIPKLNLDLFILYSSELVEVEN